MVQEPIAPSAVQLTVIPDDWEKVAARASQRAAQAEAALNAAVRHIVELKGQLAQATSSPNGVPEEARLAGKKG
jgi:hypothetical protein